MQSSGLVPTAPTPGATLYADATVLRPVADGASWTYRGTAEFSAMPTTIYENVVSQARASDGTMVESATDIGHTGGGEQAVSASGGEVSTVSGFAIAYEDPTPLRHLELRSPVRVGDQYTTLDLHRKDSGYDADGDGRNDAVDYAIYSRVIGTETVDLVHAPGVKAVRVRTTQAVRYTLTYSGQQTEVVSGTTDLWYAEGVGIVKRVDDYPASVAETGRDVVTEELVVFDGVAKGLGPMAKTELSTASGQRVQEFRAAVGYGDHVLLMAMLQPGQDAGITVHKLDARGRWESGHDVAGFPNSDAQLVRLGELALALARDDAGIVMQAFDADGVPAGSVVRLVSGTLAPLNGGWWIRAAASRDTLWVVWEEQVGGTFGTYRLQAQPFDAAGRALAAASTLTEGLSTAYSISRLSATGHASGAALVTWSEDRDDEGYLLYAVLDGQSAPNVHRIGPNAFTAVLKPAVASSALALLWVSPSSGEALSGVALAQDGSIVSTPGKQLLEEVLPVEWWSRTGGGFTLASDEAIDIFTQQPNTKLWPEDFPMTRYTLTELKLGAGPLATTGTARLLARGLDSSPTALMELDGRILIIFWESEGLSTQLVWRRP